jgi:prevent-host-death family protein
MKTMSAKAAKNAFGMMIDSARAEPVAIEKHGRRVVVVVAAEEFERLQAVENAVKDRTKRARGEDGR